MTTNYHTPIAVGASANAAIINAPLGALDSQIATATAASTDANLLTTTRFVDAAFTENVPLKRHATLAAAINNAAAGDTIVLGNGTFVGNITIPHDGITIRGNKTALFDGSSLTTGGTIIQGTIDLNGKLGTVVRDLTIDVSSSAADGILTGSPAIAAYGQRVFHNLVIIGSGAGNSYHGLLLQRGDYNQVSNVYVHGFTHGIAVKCGFTNISNIIAEDTSASSVIVKADGGTGDIRAVNINNVILKGTASQSVGAVLIESAIDTQEIEDINISNVVGAYTDPATIYIARNAAVGTIQHINVSNCVSRENTDSGGANSAAFWNKGASDVSFTNCRAINTAKYSFQNTGSGQRISLNGCASDNPASGDTNGPFVNRGLAGKVNNAVGCYLTADASITTGLTFQAVSWTAEQFDEAEMHSLLSNQTRLIARGAGDYEITATLKYDLNANGQRYIRLNPSSGSPSFDNIEPAVSGTQFTRVITTGIFTLAENDYIEVETTQNSGGALDLIGGAGNSTVTMRKL